jgi:hypothetical protein
LPSELGDRKFSKKLAKSGLIIVLTVAFMAVGWLFYGMALNAVGIYPIWVWALVSLCIFYLGVVLAAWGVEKRRYWLFGVGIIALIVGVLVGYNYTKDAIVWGVIFSICGVGCNIAGCALLEYQFRLISKLARTSR